MDEFQVWKEDWRWKSSQLLSLVTLDMCNGCFPIWNVLLPTLCMTGSFSKFSIISNVSTQVRPSLATPVSQAQSLVYLRRP